MMKHLTFSYTMAVLFFSMFVSASFAQTLPTFPPIGPGGNPGTWAGDTIIIYPITDPAGGILSPHSAPRIFSIYKDDVIIISSERNIHFAYELINESANLSISSNAFAAPSLPLYIDLTTLPSGHYTLLLYINRECLEGEFEKD